MRGWILGESDSKVRYDPCVGSLIKISMPCPFAWLSKVFPDLVPPHGMPLSDRSEEGALTLLKESGFDLRTPLGDLADRYGLLRPGGNDEEVPLPPVTTLSTIPLFFVAPYRAENAALPCAAAHALYLVHEDAERNRAEIAAELRMRLGPGNSFDPPNTDEEWVFGRISLRVTKSLPESPTTDVSPSSSDSRLRFAAKVVLRVVSPLGA